LGRDAETSGKIGGHLGKPLTIGQRAQAEQVKRDVPVPQREPGIITQSAPFFLNREAFFRAPPALSKVRLSGQCI